MKPGMYGHDDNQICLYHVFRWQDGVEIHDELEIIWRGNYPVVCFSLTLADFLEGVLHFYDIPLLHLLKNYGCHYRVFVQGEMCAVARLLAKEYVLIGLENVWRLLRACYGDVLEMEYVPPDILRFSHSGLRNLKVIEVACDVLGWDFLKSVHTEFDWLCPDNKQADGLGEKTMLKIKQIFENDYAANRAANSAKEALLSENQRLKEELKRLRSEVDMLRFELTKVRTVPYSPDVVKENDTGNKSTIISNIELGQKVQDYLFQRKKNNTFIHDLILDILSYFSGEALPEEELIKILDRELNTYDNSVKAVLRAFPYFYREANGWRFDPDIHHTLLACLTEFTPVENAPAMIAATREVEKEADYIKWAVNKWDLLKRGGKRALLLYLIDHKNQSFLNIVNRELIQEMDTLAAEVYQENIFSTEQCLWMVEQFVRQGCYQFAAKVYDEEVREHPACKLAYLMHIVLEGQTDYKAGELLAIILQSNFIDYLSQCHEIVLDNLLKVSLILGYESDLWQIIGNQVDRIATSDVLRVFRKCLQEGSLEKHDLTGLSAESKLDKLFIDALCLYLSDTLADNFNKDLINTIQEFCDDNESKDLGWQVRDIFLSCLTDMPTSYGLPALKETPKMFINTLPSLHSHITVKNLRVKTNVTAVKAQQILETGVALGFLEHKSNYYLLTEVGVDLQQVEREEKWKLILKNMIKYAVFQKSIKKLVADGKISEQDVLSIIDGLIAGKKIWNKLPYAWLKDVLVELNVVQVREGMIELKPGILE